jgi:hypothetical protein
MLLEDSVKLVDDADTRIDHDALLSRSGRHHETVGAECLRREAHDQHNKLLPYVSWRA